MNAFIELIILMLIVMQQFLVRLISYYLTFKCRGPLQLYFLFCLFAIYSQVFQVLQILNNSTFMCKLQFRARTQESSNFCMKMFNAKNYGGQRQNGGFFSNNDYLCLFYWTWMQCGSSLKCVLLSVQSSLYLSVCLNFCIWLEIYNLQNIQTHTCT